MRNFKSFFISIISLGLLFGCTINQMDAPKNVGSADSLELELAKKSLRLIKEQKTDSLMLLLNDDIREKTKPEQMKWLLENGGRVMSENQFPLDTTIKVAIITKKTISSEEVSKEFTFPFTYEKNPDSTMYFKIVIANNKINKLILTTGMRFQTPK